VRNAILRKQLGYAVQVDVKKRWLMSAQRRDYTARLSPSVSQVSPAERIVVWSPMIVTSKGRLLAGPDVMLKQ
jgi:hypothetical protein